MSNNYNLLHYGEKEPSFESCENCGNLTICNHYILHNKEKWYCNECSDIVDIRQIRKEITELRLAVDCNKSITEELQEKIKNLEAENKKLKNSLANSKTYVKPKQKPDQWGRLPDKDGHYGPPEYDG